MKKLLIVAATLLSVSVSATSAGAGALRATANQMSDSTLCLTTGVATGIVESGGQHDPEGYKNLATIFSERVNKMTADEFEVCKLSFAVGYTSATEE